MSKWTEKELQKLVKEGKIRGYQVKSKSAKSPAGRIVSKHRKYTNVEKNWIAETLLTWCNERVLQLQQEYKFHEKRKWKFDWCIESLKVAFEYEGIYSENSRHTNRKGYSKDTEKYNAATALGWRVFRYTSLTYKNLETDLNACG